jgi:voltage-gated potassium channel Kch
MALGSVLIIGSGRLAIRIRRLAAARGHAVVPFPEDAFAQLTTEHSAVDALRHALQGIDLTALAAVFLVDDRDEHNLALLIALISLDKTVPIVVSLFNERIAPHLQAAHPHVHVLNPAKLAAPVFVRALITPLTHSLRYVPAKLVDDGARTGNDHLIRKLILSFGAVVAAAVIFFHFAEHLTWLNAAYFVIVTVATVGYGDITLLNSGAVSKVAGIILILLSTAFIWMIFSLTVDTIIKRRVQRALGRKRYAHSGHVILCGLGRLGTFIAEGLLQQGETVVIVEQNADLPVVDHCRALGADVYIGDARLPRVLQDVGVTRAKALYSVINNDMSNLEIGLNARSFDPQLRLVLRMFDESMSERIREHLDIHLTFSMTAIADDAFFNAIAT